MTFVLQDTNEKIEGTKDIESDLTYPTHKAGWHLAQYAKHDIEVWAAKGTNPVSEKEFVEYLLSTVIDVAVTGVAQFGYKFSTKDVLKAVIDAAAQRAMPELFGAKSGD